MTQEVKRENETVLDHSNNEIQISNNLKRQKRQAFYHCYNKEQSIALEIPLRAKS